MAVPEVVLSHLKEFDINNPVAEQVHPCSHGKALLTQVSVRLWLVDKALLGAGTTLRCCILWIKPSPSRGKRKGSLQCYTLSGPKGPGWSLLWKYLKVLVPVISEFP